MGGAAAPMPNRNARKLRKTMTDAERAMWRFLRERQVEGKRFRRQVPIDHYIVDFACFEARLIIEVDGGQGLERKVVPNIRVYLACFSQFVELCGYSRCRTAGKDLQPGP